MKNTTTIPHSWSIENWPADVWPGSASRARYVVRANRDSLILAGALTRVGRELVVFGAKYGKWLEKQVDHVVGYECPANRTSTSMQNVAA